MIVTAGLFNETDGDDFFSCELPEKSIKSTPLKRKDGKMENSYEKNP